MMKIFMLAGPSCGNIISKPTEWHTTKEKQISSLMQKLIAFSLCVGIYFVYLSEFSHHHHPIEPAKRLSNKEMSKYVYSYI